MVEVLEATVPLKLDLACGQTPRDGFDGVDLQAPGAKYKLDLLKFPWPWKDSSVDELHCSHFIEHIPMEYVNQWGEHGHNGKDLFEAFFDECYRVLVPGGIMHVACPCARSNRAFQDPTHRRFIVAETFMYLDMGWKKANKLEHCHGICDFEANIAPLVAEETKALHPLAAQQRMNERWNVIGDWAVTLRSRKV
jgi:predicted SAM-dependent methyltransferase